MAYAPVRRLAFVPAIKNCAVFANYGGGAKIRGLEPCPSGFRHLDGQACGNAVAIDADTGQAVWEVCARTLAGGGVLATTGGPAFTGDGEGNLLAYDSDSGEAGKNCGRSKQPMAATLGGSNAAFGFGVGVGWALQRVILSELS